MNEQVPARQWRHMPTGFAQDRVEGSVQGTTQCISWKRCSKSKGCIQPAARLNHSHGLDGVQALQPAQPLCEAVDTQKIQVQ